MPTNFSKSVCPVTSKGMTRLDYWAQFDDLLDAEWINYPSLSDYIDQEHNLKFCDELQLNIRKTDWTFVQKLLKQTGIFDSADIFAWLAHKTKQDSELN